MFRAISFIVVTFLICLVSIANGLRWIPMSFGDAIPNNAIKINDLSNEYVGRARHFDEVLPAQINATTGVIESCGFTIAKQYYEILVSREKCRWQQFNQIEQVWPNIVRAGTAANAEPIYIGRSMRQNGVRRIDSIYLTSKTKNTWSPNSMFMLECNDNSQWIDTAAAHVPNNTVYGGESKDGNHIYVARLKSGCSIIPGQALPELGVATAVYKSEKIQSPYCQILVGDTEEYKWARAAGGDIPDYAVASSIDKNRELMYVALLDKTIGYVTTTIAAKLNTSYDILVKNEN